VEAAIFLPSRQPIDSPSLYPSALSLSAPPPLPIPLYPFPLACIIIITTAAAATTTTNPSPPALDPPLCLGATWPCRLMNEGCGVT